MTVSHDLPEKLLRRTPRDEGSAKRFRTSFTAVWSFATVIFAVSGLYFYVVTGVAKMLIPAALVAMGIGLIGTVKVVAAIDVVKRRTSG